MADPKTAPEPKATEKVEVNTPKVETQAGEDFSLTPHTTPVEEPTVGHERVEVEVHLDAAPATELYRDPQVVMPVVNPAKDDGSPVLIPVTQGSAPFGRGSTPAEDPAAYTNAGLDMEGRKV